MEAIRLGRMCDIYPHFTRFIKERFKYEIMHTVTKMLINILSQVVKHSHAAIHTPRQSKVYNMKIELQSTL